MDSIELFFMGWCGKRIILLPATTGVTADAAAGVNGEATGVTAGIAGTAVLLGAERDEAGMTIP